MSFDGDLYPTAGATSVMTTKGDVVRYNTERERYGIGSAGQVLQVASSLPTWSTINLADSVLTTQGDVLYEGASALARLGQSTANYTLATKGAGANPAWQPSSTSVLTTTGDLLYASGANTLARLAGGTSGDILTANGAGVAPSYQTPAAGGATTVNTSAWIEISFSTTSTSFVDATSYTHTLSNVSGGSYMLVFSFCFSITVSEASTRMRAVHDTTNLTEWFVNSRSWMNDQSSGAQSWVGDTDGSVVKIQTKISSGTFNLINTSNRGEGSFLEVS